MLTAVLLGFVLGLRHAADPDHVAAVAALVARHRRPGIAAWIGTAWGAGHSLTILAIGAVIVLLRVAVPASFATAAELLVAAILIALGIANLRSLRSGATHTHPAATHTLGATAARAFGIGIAHGLGGSAAVALLALAAMPTPQAAIVYLAVFSAGTVGGMVALSFGLGIPLSLAGDTPHLSRWVLGGSGALSICAGIYLALSTGAFPLAL